MKVLRSYKGFTLIELLVVIAIIGVLAGILLPVLSRSRETSRSTQCMNNIKQIGMGLIMYANENNDQFPSDTAYGGASPAMRGLNLLYDTYVSDKKSFNCPSDTTVTTATQDANMGTAASSADEAFDLNECSYGYDRSHNQAHDPDVAILADRPPTDPTVTPAPSSPNHKGRGQNVFYVDGHVEFVTSPLAGWYATDGTMRDNIYTNTAGGNGVSTIATDTVILHDGGS